MKRSLFLATALFFIGCSQNAHKSNLDGEKLLQQKCSQCHNLDLPPQTFENEKAPPMMAVAFHVKNFVPANNESERIPNAIAFVKDYVIAPSRSKSFCDKESLDSYGVMPSQKGKVTQDELQAIAQYIFFHFTQKNLDEAQQIQNKLNAMPKGERLVLTNGCLACHRVDKKIVGPAFQDIAKKKGNSLDVLIHSIKNGSKNKYVTSKGAIMPSFKKLNDDDIKTIAQWILSLNKESK
ncbi:cytochrome c class I [hydrothermal vent metagenome]|uniref:Cytochrome c class I n=1 Tax=hydrothermal vent metagenome TaxID=652676 RepID=A0A1W1D5V3_9ZZZZ